MESLSNVSIGVDTDIRVRRSFQQAMKENKKSKSTCHLALNSGPHLALQWELPLESTQFI